MGIRKEWDDPQFRENFELLSIRANKWLEIIRKQRNELLLSECRFTIANV